MSNDIFSGITHSELKTEEKNEFQEVMVTATLTVEAIARKNGMSWERRDIYRKFILGQHTEQMTACEVKVCKNVSEKEKNAIRKVEKIKYRLLEGFVKLLSGCVTKKIGMARRFTRENTYHIRRDLNSEAMTAFCHAVYRFNRYDIQFSTFLTTVVNNWLTTYCQKLSTIKLPEQLKQDLMVYYTIRAAEVDAERIVKFEQIVRVIVLNEMRDMAIAATERNIADYILKNHERFVELRQATSNIVQINNDPIPAGSSANFETLLRDMTDNMTPMQRAIIEHKLLGGGLQGFADKSGIQKKHALKAFRSAKKIILAT